VLELVEVCLDFDLQGNQLRLRFSGSPVVKVSVQETARDVVFLVTTANSVHRLAFTHPALLHSRVRHRAATAVCTVCRTAVLSRWFVDLTLEKSLKNLSPGEESRGRLVIPRILVNHREN